MTCPYIAESPAKPSPHANADSAADADFTINATNRALNERDNGTNFNPAGATHEEFGQDGDTNDIYRSAIRGVDIGVPLFSKSATSHSSVAMLIVNDVPVGL